MDVFRPAWEIESEAINQDDPTNETFDVQEPEVVYGGSEASTSDNLKLRAEVKPRDLEVLRYSWSVSGPGALKYQPPPPSPDAEEWDVGDIAAEAGVLEFKVVAELAGGAKAEGKKTVEVGIRSDEVLVIGWIDPDGVPLPGEGMDAGMLQFYPLSGAAEMSVVQQTFTLAHLGLIAGTGSTVHPVVMRPMTDAEKTHILNWQFRFAGNFCSKDRCPPKSFSSQSAVVDFEIGKPNSYKLFNRFQVKYRTKDGITLRTAPVVLQEKTQVGVTNNPVTDRPEPGELGPNEGRFRILSDRTYLINDGTPISLAVNGFNVLTDPLKWNHIGSRVEFSVTGGTGGLVLPQVYPTYYVFRNLKLVTVFPQAPSPLGNFNRNPYPPGPAPFIP